MTIRAVGAMSVMERPSSALDMPLHADGLHNHTLTLLARSCLGAPDGNIRCQLNIHACH